MISNLFLLGIRRPGPVLLALLAITAVTAAGLPRLTIDTSFNSLIPADDPAKLIHQRVMSEFGSDNKTIVYVRDPELWTPEKLRALDDLQRSLKQIDHVYRVDSLFSLRTIRGESGPDGPVEVQSTPVLDGIPDTAEEAEAARRRALDNPLYLGNFFSDQGDVTAIIVTAHEPEEPQDINPVLYAGIEEAVERHAKDFERIFQVGPPRINAELKASLYEDFKVLGPLSALVLVVAIIVFLRSSLAAVIPILTSGLSIVWTFGLLGWMGVPLNILSAMIPSLIIVIGSTEDTHIMAAYFRGLIKQGDSVDKKVARGKAIEYLARHVGLPLVLTVLTTALGFASNLLSSITLIQQFAIAATLAMITNGIVTIFAVPLVLAHLGGGEPPASFARESDPQSIGPSLPNHIIRIFRISQDHFPTGTLAVTAILCVFFLYHASKLYVTNDPLSYFPSDRPLVQETHMIHEDLAGIRVFFITVEAENDKAFLEPENVKRLASIQRFMDKQGVFDSSISLADHLAYINREFQGDFGRDAIPATRQLIAQYLLFFHRGELESYVSHDYRRANIIVRHSISDSHTLNQYIRELEDVVDQLTGPTLEAEIIGENLMVNRAAESLMVAQVKALALLLGLIFVLMSIMFTSLKGGIIAMIPSVIPIALMFGLMGLLDIPLNPGTAMVAVIAVGIAIDGTIHLLARYNELCRRTSDFVGAVHQAVGEVAAPLIVSSVALALGFGVLLMSNFTVVAQFGALAAATMLISIVANLLITPIIMARVRLVGLYQMLGIKVDREVLESAPLFAGMSNYQRRKAILISEMGEFEAGQCLVKQGEVGRCMYLILEGEAEVIRHDGDQQRSLAILKPGQIFGEVGYIRDIERTADVAATKPVTALRFDFERMQKDLKFFPHIVAKLNFNISAVLGERLADVLDQR